MRLEDFSLDEVNPEMNETCDESLTHLKSDSSYSFKFVGSLDFIKVIQCIMPFGEPDSNV